jgi:AcrR family transcriptional regulator
MEAPTPSRGGRPARLSREAVVGAARAIIERDGVEALTMRNVARELGSSPMAIYRHVRDKDDLLVGVLDCLAADVPRPRFSNAPRERVLQACRAMHDGLAEHDWVVDVLAQGDLIARTILWVTEVIVAGLIDCGLSERQAADGYRAIWQFTVGELMIRRGLRRTAALGRTPFVVEVLTSVDAQEFPALARVAPQWAAARERDS